MSYRKPMAWCDDCNWPGIVLGVILGVVAFVGALSVIWHMFDR